jgi:hypothetical protein
MEQALLSSVSQASVVDVVVVGQMVMCGKIGASASSSASQYSMFATRGNRDIISLVTPRNGG